LRLERPNQVWSYDIVMDTTDDGWAVSISGKSTQSINIKSPLNII
jgi:hypothetical protein